MERSDWSTSSKYTANEAISLVETVSPERGGEEERERSFLFTSGFSLPTPHRGVPAPSRGNTAKYSLRRNGLSEEENGRTIFCADALDGLEIYSRLLLLLLLPPQKCFP